MEHNQDNLLQYVYGIYKQLSHVQVQQWKLLEADDVDWDVMTSLFEQWDILSRSVEGIVTPEHYEVWQSDARCTDILSDMKSMLDDMSVRANTIEYKVNTIKAETSGDIQETKAHQTVLHAYGGLDRPNLGSIYFDEKK